MKKLYVIEIRLGTGTDETMRIMQNNSLCVYEFKKTAKIKLNEIYENQKETMKKLNVKPYAKNRFVIKEYINNEKI